jgi:integrase/recombinase XerD
MTDFAIEPSRARSPTNFVVYRDASGVERRVPLASDKTAAQTMLSDIITREERKAAGLIDKFDEHANRPLAEHLKDYRRHLESKENAESHVKQTISYIEKLLAGCGFKFIRDMSASRVSTWLAELRDKGRSIRTSNAYLTAVKGFSRWLVRDRRAAEDVLAHLSALNAKVDVRHERRTLEPVEIAKLINAARMGKRFRSLSGEDRAVLYHVAVTTGLRASELASLTPRSFDLVSDPPTIKVEAAYSKHRRQDILPLRPDVADVLRKHLAEIGRAANEPLWSGSWSRNGSAKMIRMDLKAAEIPYKDEADRVFDFHCLRHQFISTLARSGAHPKEAQALARHSTITLTMDRYTHLAVVDLTSALDRLPAIPTTDPSNEAIEQRATGTGGAVECQEKVPSVVPRGAENGAERLASGTLKIVSHCTDDERVTTKTRRSQNAKSPDKNGASRASSHRSASNGRERRAWDSNPQPLAGHLISSQNYRRRGGRPWQRSQKEHYSDSRSCSIRRASG